RMKIEVQAARAAAHGLSLHDRLVGYLPRYAPVAARLPWLLNLRDSLRAAAALSERVAGLSARRSLPRWRSDWFRDPGHSPSSGPRGHRCSQGAAAPPPRLPSGRLRPSSTGYGEGRGEGASPQAQTRGGAPSPGAQERADLSPQAGRGEEGRAAVLF